MARKNNTTERRYEVISSVDPEFLALPEEERRERIAESFRQVALIIERWEARRAAETQT